ncbi:MAG: GAF domain-containing protein [Lacisediminihabitans sp.]
MRMWRAGIKVTLVRIPRPFDEPHTSAPGGNSDRVLIFGAGLAVGWGVSTHDLALPGFLARSLSSLTGRGADVDVIADPDILLNDALRMLNALPLWRYDAVVVVLGVNAALHLDPLKIWRRDLAALLAGLEESFRGKPVVITSVQRIRSIPAYDSILGSIADRQATILNRATAGICARSTHAIFARLPDFALPSPGRYRSPDTFAESARVVATALAPALAIPQHQDGDSYQPLPYDEDRAEEARQAAVDALDLTDSELAKGIDQILALAQVSLEVPAALLTLVDHDRLLLYASAGSSPTETPRAGSFCDLTVRQRGRMVVPDARQDDRFRDNVLVVGDPHIRFYAGFPLESNSGERLGTLCVFDTKPRQADDIDLVELRNLALRMQRELRTAR